MGPQKIQKSKVLKIKIRSAQIVGEFFCAGERRPRPIWGPPGPFFAWAGQIQKLSKFCLFSLVGPWALFTRFGALAAIHPRWGNRLFVNDHGIFAFSVDNELLCIQQATHGDPETYRRPPNAAPLRASSPRGQGFRRQLTPVQ